MESFNTSQSAFCSRRSYPALNHISLAPLTPRFPLDDEDVAESSDYFTARDPSPDQTYSNITQAVTGRTSYLSSVSVPSTPSILSHSRSGSRKRQHGPLRSKSHARLLPLSDTNLSTHDTAGQPFHHRRAHDSRAKTKPKTATVGAHQDSEWLLRAGIALASSTREEKGQSWLAKRESSTSLVADMTPAHDGKDPNHCRRNRSQSHARWSRSGASTPAAGALSFSRRASRSRGGSRSRRGSRAELLMTSFEISQSMSTSKHKYAALSVSEDGGIVPDFVDERVRAEMVSIQQDFDGGDDEFYSLSASFRDDEEDEEEAGEEDEQNSNFDSMDSEEEDEIDEQELQRLTRQRGFGLGSWLDRFVEWTLFGVDDHWPAGNSSDAAGQQREMPVQVASGEDGGSDIGLQNHSKRTVRINEHDASADDDDDDDDDGDDNASEIAQCVTSDEDAQSSSIEAPGDAGGWEDLGWLFQVMKRALV